MNLTERIGTYSMEVEMPKKPITDDELQLLTQDEVQSLLRVSRTWLFMHRDDLPQLHIGGKLRYRRRDVLKLIEDAQSAKGIPKWVRKKGKQ